MKKSEAVMMMVGCGAMGTALAKGLVSGGVLPASSVVCYDVDQKKAAALQEALDVKAAHDLTDAAQADVILLCVKPDKMAEVCQEISQNTKNKLIISIAAGITLQMLKDWLPEASCVRAMPNTPCSIGKGVVAYCCSENVMPEQQQFVQEAFSAVGCAQMVAESQMEAVTALSGSGPAYVFLMIEALADAGVITGLPRQLALEFAANTVAGAAEMAAQTGIHPGILKDNVCSPGGTTIHGVEALEAAGFRSACIKAVRAAYERANQMKK